MAIEYLKKALRTPTTGEEDTRQIVSEMLSELRKGGEEKAREYGEKLDGYSGEIVIDRATIEAAARQIPERLKEDLRFARKKVAEFARRQRESLREFETELSPGVWAGQRRAHGFIPRAQNIARTPTCHSRGGMG